MAKLSVEEVEEVREVFDLFDFWDGRDGVVDAVKTGDLLRCVGLNPTEEWISKHGGTKKLGEKQYAFEEFLPIYEEMSKIEDIGTFSDFTEAFKTIDRESQGFITTMEMRHMMTVLGERLTDEQLDEIVKLIDLREDLDGNIKYEDFIGRVMKGPQTD